MKAVALTAVILAAQLSAAEIPATLRKSIEAISRGSLTTKSDLINDAQDFVFFADFVHGSGWSFQVAISNNSPTDTLREVMAFTVDTSHPGAVSWSEAYEAGVVPRFTIPPGGTRIYDEWPNISPGEVVRGGVIILQHTPFPPFQSDTQMLSAVLTYRNDATGVEVTVPPLRVDDLTPPFFNDEVAFSIFVEENADVTTGFALWKTNTNEVCMGLADLEGQLFETPEGYNLYCYGPKYGDQFNHSVAMLPEWFSEWTLPENFQGLLLISVQDDTFGPKGNDGLAVPMGLRANRNSGAISAMPVVPVAFEVQTAKVKALRGRRVSSGKER